MIAPSVKEHQNTQGGGGGDKRYYFGGGRKREKRRNMAIERQTDGQRQREDKQAETVRQTSEQNQ